MSVCTHVSISLRSRYAWLSGCLSICLYVRRRYVLCSYACMHACMHASRRPYVYVKDVHMCTHAIDGLSAFGLAFDVWPRVFVVGEPCPDSRCDMG